MSIQLTAEQKKFFHDQGYLHVPGVVPVERCRGAMQAINHSIGQGIDLSRIDKLRATSYCQELKEQPVLTDLVNATGVIGIAEQLMGEGKVVEAASGQVALRFPKPPGAEPKTPGGHIDGVGTGTNGIPKGEFRRFFSMLCVVLLDDLPDRHCGNFTVWPGSHLKMEAKIREIGIEALADGTPKLADPGQPLMTTGRQGDVVLAHYLTLHGVGPHVGPRIRYAAIFRIRHVNAEANNVAGYTDKWLEFDGIRALDAATV